MTPVLDFFHALCYELFSHLFNISTAPLFPWSIKEKADHRAKMLSLENK